MTEDNLTAYEAEQLAKVGNIVVDGRVLSDDGYERLVRATDPHLVADYAARIRLLSRRLARAERETLPIRMDKL